MIILIVVVFAITALIGIPIAFCMGLVSLASLLAEGRIFFLKLIAQKMITGIDKFPLMAIPLFILAGNIMTGGGLTRSLIKFANFLVGHISGGLAHVNIVSSIFFAGITGVAVADSSVLGSIFVPAMKKEGYDVDFSAAVTASSSIIGPIIPPSVPFVLYGCTVRVSIAGLLLAGMLTGILLGLALMVVSYFISKKRNYPVTKAPISLREFVISFKDTALALVMPLIILGGLLSGVFTPTEAAGVAVVYALIISLFVLRTLKFSDLPPVFINSGITASIVLMLISTANIFGTILATQQIPQRIAQLMLSVTTNPWMMLLLVNIFLLVAGMFMAESPNIILLGPILAPVVTGLGIHSLHFGLVMVLNLTIGLITPPLGACLFILCGISKLTLEELTKAILPFLVTEIAVLFLCTYVPAIPMFLPKLLGFA
ncbi:C4-dicarboxylate ABC transporter permease [Candidatus Aerophobetes bacterium]|uniref:C4-dicarboxylate ABC transporter permease n=1 Tax=Aerophobetes bacterium TaxID=2030807 RepID=A0A662D4P8_UNCAE|nr:MAG: C4-dicarboxylate ABC transporter permease [Candidatus Aerophobetes bacterium]